MSIQGKNVVILSHRNPDADALGSSFALYHALKENNNVSVIVPTPYASFLDFIVGDEEIIIYTTHSEQAKKKIKASDILYFVDFSSYDQLGGVANLVKTVEKHIILIDHHKNPSVRCSESFSDDSACSAAILMYEYIKNTLNIIPSKFISECIYAGIISDTGSFAYPSVSQRTHRVVSELFEYGIEHSEVQNLLFNSYSKERLDYIAFCLGKMEYLEEEKAVIIAISYEEMQEKKHQLGYNDSIVNFGLRLSEYEISIFIAENEDKSVKISFRSKKNIAINEFASEYFQGGGHKNAAGARTKLTLSQTVSKIREHLKVFCKSEEKK